MPGSVAQEMKCKLCGETPPIKSNRGVVDELHRLLAYLDPEPEPSCPSPKCRNHGNGLYASRRSYQSFGKTRHGSTRYLCKACRKTFSVAGPTTGQKKPHHNREVFMELVNKAPFRRILEKRDITAATLYAKIDFLFEQCQRYLASRELKLLERFPLGHLSISVDRQDYYTNWTRRDDRRNIPVHAVVSADNRSGYVFGAHLNYDPRFDPVEVEADVRTDDDDKKERHHRRYARFWLAADYAKSLAESAGAKRFIGKKTVLDSAMAAYANANSRTDIEASDSYSATTKLPDNGMQVHGEYTFYAHFFALKRLLSGAQSITFYLDQDSGIRAACLAAFQEEITQDFVHAFYVRTNKDMTKGQKLVAHNEALKCFEEAKARFAHSGPNPKTDVEVKLAIIRERLPSMREIGDFRDRWLLHPLPTMNEPEKALSCLTDRKDSQLTKDGRAYMYLYGSMHGADRFLETIRRRLSPLERALSTSSASGRRWYGYAPYNPAIIEKLLTILRVYYNYCLVSKGSGAKGTPAMRLGLAKGPVRVEDVIYFGGPSTA